MWPSLSLCLVTCGKLGVGERRPCPPAKACQDWAGLGSVLWGGAWAWSSDDLYSNPVSHISVGQCVKGPLHSVWDMVDAWFNFISLYFCFKKKKNFESSKHLFDLMPSRTERKPLNRVIFLAAWFPWSASGPSWLLVSPDWHLHNQPVATVQEACKFQRFSICHS